MTKLRKGPVRFGYADQFVKKPPIRKESGAGARKRSFLEQFLGGFGEDMGVEEVDT